MSSIDEIMGAIGRHGDDCIRDGDASSESFEALRELIAAALADAERKGAEAMRETAAWQCKQKAEREGAKAMEVEDDEPDMVDSLKATAWDFMVMESKIHALPLPTGERQAVLLTDGQIKQARNNALCDAPDGVLMGRVAGLCHPELRELSRAIEAAVLAANGLETAR